MSVNVDLGTKLNIITDYYGAGTIWDRMSIDGLSADQINAMYNSLPAQSFSIDRTPTGLNLGRNYNNPFELPVVPGTDFDSNIPGGSYGGGNTFSGGVPANIITDPSTGAPIRQTAGALNGSGLTVATIADRISLAVAGVNIGAKLGMKIDEALYSLNPKWWDEHLPTINPQTWNNLVGVNPVGDFFLRVLFGIDGNSMTGYISDDLLAYYYQMLRDAGAWADPSQASTADIADPSILHTNLSVPFSVGSGGTNLQTWNNENPQTYYNIYNTTGTYTICIRDYTTSPSLHVVTFSTGSCQIIKTGWNADTVISSALTTWNGTPFQYASSGAGSFGSSKWPLWDGITVIVTGNLDDIIRDIGTVLFDGTVTSPQTIDGMQPMPQATQYPPTNITGTTPPQVKQQLQQQYPDLFQDAITETTMQDDGTTTTTTYVPLPWVTEGLNPENPTTGEGKTQTDTQVDEETGQQTLPTTPQDEQTQPPDTGEGSTPIPPVPTGSASSLWAVYNPSQGELNSFGAWLWSSNFVEQIKKLFADPMQAIIGVHKVFATPHTGGSQTIKCGYLDSGVSASVVTSQYTTVDCGSASLREYFGNVFDYDPFTKVSIFLPFIGIVPLNTADVMRSTVSVKYKVDVITGACLAEVSISRDGGGGILYIYGGSAIVTYPVSSGSYVGAVQAALSTAIGIGSAIATGGASLGASAGMVLGGLSHAKTQVQHSGQFSGSSGAMGGKKPYLIVSRPQTRTPSKIDEYMGIPSNAIHKLSSCTGFVKVNEVHIKSKSAYDNEIQEIESLLKTGVII